MERPPIFTGAATALVTPLNENGVDYENFKKLMNDEVAYNKTALCFFDLSRY